MTQAVQQVNESPSNESVAAAAAPTNATSDESVITQALELTAEIYSQMVERTLPFMNNALSQINGELANISTELANTASSDTKQIYALKGNQTVLTNSSQNLQTLVSAVSNSATTVGSIFQKMATILGQTVSTMSQQW